MAIQTYDIVKTTKFGIITWMVETQNIPFSDSVVDSGAWVDEQNAVAKENYLLHEVYFCLNSFWSPTLFTPSRTVLFNLLHYRMYYAWPYNFSIVIKFNN